MNKKLTFNYRMIDGKHAIVKKSTINVTEKRSVSFFLFPFFFLEQPSAEIVRQ